MARERFAEALELRHAWTETEPRNVAAKSYTSEAEVWLGVAFSHLGDWPNASGTSSEAVQICTRLAEPASAATELQGDLASVCAEQGAAWSEPASDDEAEEASTSRSSFPVSSSRATPTTRPSGW